MSLGMLRSGWSSCVVLCLSWALVAWQTGTKKENQQVPADAKPSNDRAAQRAREGRMPFLTMDQVMDRLHENESLVRTRPIVEVRTGNRQLHTPPSPMPVVVKTAVAAQSAPQTASSAVPAESAPPAASPAVEPSVQQAPLTPKMAELRSKLRRALEMYFPRHQNVRDNNAWEVMHAIIAYGVDTQLFRSGPDGERVNAVGWLCYNYPCAGDRMLFVNNGKIEARRGVGVQGHHGQFLAILAQSHVMRDYPMYVSGQQFTLEDLIEFEKANCVAGEELTFKLIALMHYLDSDATWKSRDGQEWSIQKLIREELAQPIRGAACGGTHRLMGFSYAVNKRLQRGEPVVGEFQRAQKFIQDYHRYTIGLQNPDGSFSTEWFVRRGNSPDIDRRLKTSGHILEWMAFSVSQPELEDPKMVAAADYLSTLLLTHGKHKWEIGPLGHGLHALALYNSRLFKDNQIARPTDLVMGPPALPEAPRQAHRPQVTK